MSKRGKGNSIKPAGQKKLTNIAVVRYTKSYRRFEVACFKNKVLSWRSGAEKHIDEVLQSHTVYSSVSKGVIARSDDMLWCFGTADITANCMEILQKGELQVGGMERDTQAKRPYSVGMIERLMREIHFSVDPHDKPKKQAIQVIRELQKHYPIKRTPMRLKLVVPEEGLPFLMEKLNSWSAEIVSQDGYGNQLVALVCEIAPSFFRDCDALVRNYHGRVEIVEVSVHFEKDANVDNYDGNEDVVEPSHHTAELDVIKLSERLQKQSIFAVGDGATEKRPNAEVEVVEVKQNKCNTCNAFILGDIKQYREHFKSEWHKCNVRRKTRKLPPLSADECALEETNMGDDANTDLKEYLF
ncbi:hypothetical protein MKW98_028053 [Papaver atlanticum]|uniref:Ribosome maturation protein SBDS n=1 Tax=Papaver atlanticum TaxID=357466 RepID=A0AAD4XM71_9MAGN|nr:hypothetical protein MKW98_028053 [Papaver atlanticum]